MERVDVVVVGAGFGGLGAALTLADRGARVLLVERLAYAGGCASTFVRRGQRHEAGATLVSGLGPGQLFARWNERFSLGLHLELLDPVVRYDDGTIALAVPPDRDRLVAALGALPGVPRDRLAAFFAAQAATADALWALLDDPGLLPPFRAGGLVAHLRASPRTLPLLGLVGRSLESVLARYGLHDVAPVRSYLDSACQITIQTDVAHAEAPFALGALDYVFRGAGHVRGGFGALATALVGAIEALGGQVRLACGAKQIVREGRGFQVQTRSGPVVADHVVANLLPAALLELAPGLGASGKARLQHLDRRVRRGWGAAMWYLHLDRRASLPPEAHHLELVGDPALPRAEGNHIFVSVSAADEDRGVEGRTATVSTHVGMEALGAAPDQGAHVRAIQDTMRRVLALRAPALDAAVRDAMPGSPRTFARFVGRPGGFVGGIPRTVGLDHYAGLWPRPVEPGLWMVGDTVFPGQSAMAAAIGGVKVAEALRR